MREFVIAIGVGLAMGSAPILMFRVAPALNSHAEAIKRLEAAQSRLQRLECIHARELGITCIVTNDKEALP